MAHKQPEEGAECQICFSDIDGDNYAEWKPTEEHEWIPCVVCSECIQYLISSGWKRWVEALEKVDCAAAQRRLLLTGPPTHLRDKAIFKTEGYEDGHVHKLWFMADDEEVDARLEGALQGEARQEFWDYQLQFDFPEKAGEDAEDKGYSAEKIQQEREQLARLKEQAAERRAARAAAKAQEEAGAEKAEE